MVSGLLPFLQKMIRIGNTIRKVRIQKGISQKALARKTGLTASYLSLLERDLREPSWNVIRRIAEGLGIPSEVLIWDAVCPPTGLSDKDRKVCELAKSLVRRFYEGAFDDPSESIEEQTSQTCRIR